MRPAGLDLRIDLDGWLRSQVAFADALMRSARLMSTGDVDHDVTRLVAWLIEQSPLSMSAWCSTTSTSSTAPRLQIARAPGAGTAGQRPPPPGGA
ncbi:MAG: hypothetical protein R2705_17655 [Ilumatobacteraceae bacterium]